MKTGSITYNGKNSLELGVFTTGSGSFDAAELDVEKYEVPGRNGDVIIPKNRYKNIEITYPAFIPKAFMDKAQNVRNWLRSAKVYSRLEDTYDMDHFRLGLASGVQSFEPVNRNDGANFEMTFDCKPQRFLKAGETPETVEPDVQTESGEIVTFETVAESPMTSAEVSLSPIQSGSGDPSPTNIRPISGHTGTELYRTGKNVSETSSLASTSSGNVTANAGHFGTCKAGQTYTISFDVLEENTYAVRLRFNNGSNLISWSTGTLTVGQRVSFTYTPTADGWFNFNTANPAFPASTKVFDNVQVELGSSATAYEPYQGDTYSVTFSDQGTVYGGTMDFVSGKLMVTMVSVDLGTLNWAFQSSSNSFYVSLSLSKAYGGNVVPNAICDSYYPVMWNSFRNYDKVFAFAADVTQLRIRDSSYTDAATFKTAMSGVQLVYELATPLEYTLTPQQIETLLGENNVWSDAGPITLTYAEPFTIENPTQFEARPLFIITNPNQGDALSVSGKTITFVDSYTGTVTIDCETMNAYSGAANLNSIIEATDFPVLVPGANIVTWTGTGECTMTPRWWEL